MNLKLLAGQITNIHNKLYTKASSAINTALTLRNWWIGAYIVEYEQNGEDRAEYGAKLMPNLAKEIDIKGLSETNLRICRQFYSHYTYIFHEIQTKYFDTTIHQLPTDE